MSVLFVWLGLYALAVGLLFAFVIWQLEKPVPSVFENWGDEADIE